MRPLVAVLALTLVVACGGTEEEAPAAQPAAAAAPAPTPADFAGTWQVASVLEGTPDTVRSSMMGSPDGSTWTMTLEGRPNLPLTVSIMGDSLIAQSAEYESILRAGVMVTVRTAGVMQNGMMVGNLKATYKTPQGEQVVNGTFTATKQP